jgi:PAS domain S-box-containing protein
VLDPHGRIISLNPASAAILGLPRRHLHGRLLREILPLYSDPEDGEVGESEISLPEINPPGKTSGTAQGEVRTGMKARYYQLETSALKDWRGLEVGRLLLVHDVTEQKRAQAQLLEQQRALVMLQEREQLARDLHDSIGQTLAYAGFQVEAASKLFQDGQAVSAIAQLKRLAGVLHEAHAEVREYILDLRSAHSPQQPFFSVLRHYLEGFTNNYGIRVLFSADERLGDEPFSPEARMQVIRILQEALSNARRHGHSRCVRVTFVMEDSLVRMIVQDDGIGFDPSQPAGEDHLGLHLMRERTEGMGGVLRIESAAGEGTSVILEIPGGVKEYA